MAKCSPYYTTEDKDNDQCHHDNNSCLAGNNIKAENKAYGTGGKPLCELCEKM